MALVQNMKVVGLATKPQGLSDARWTSYNIMLNAYRAVAEQTQQTVQRVDALRMGDDPERNQKILALVTQAETKITDTLSAQKSRYALFRSWAFQNDNEDDETGHTSTQQLTEEFDPTFAVRERASVQSLKNAMLTTPEAHEYYTDVSQRAMEQSFGLATEHVGTQNVQVMNEGNAVDVSSLKEFFGLKSIALTKPWSAFGVSSIYSANSPYYPLAAFMWRQLGINNPEQADIIAMSRRLAQVASSPVDASQKARSLLVFPITFKCAITLSLDIRCAICHRSLIGTEVMDTQLEHLDTWARFKGESTVNSFSNLYCAHKSCNNARGDTPFLTWASNDSAQAGKVSNADIQLAARNSNINVGVGADFFPSLSAFSNVDQRKVQVAYYNLYRRFSSEAEATNIAIKYLNQPENSSIKDYGGGRWTPLNLVTLTNLVNEYSAPEFPAQLEEAVKGKMSRYTQVPQRIDITESASLVAPDLAKSAQGVITAMRDSFNDVNTATIKIRNKNGTFNVKVPVRIDKS